jgi:hypothetical protein
MFDQSDLNTSIAAGAMSLPLSNYEVAFGFLWTKSVFADSLWCHSLVGKNCRSVVSAKMIPLSSDDSRFSFARAQLGEFPD